MVIGRWIRSGLADSSKKNTILLLDGVRAFACFIVIWFHIYRIPRDLQVWDPSSVAYPLLDSFLYFGRYGVTLFFVLSGFLLFMPFGKALLFAEKWPSVRQFYLQRIFRIIPAYYLSLILIVLLFQRQYLQPQHWQELALFFTFFMDSSQATFKQLNAPFWTLAVEWQFYMLLPLVALGMRLVVSWVKRGYRLLTIVACLLLLIGWGIFSRYFGTYFQQHPAETVLVPRAVLNGVLFFTYGLSGKYLEDFGVGMLLSLCFVYAWHSSEVRAILRKLSPWLWGSGLLCLFAMVLWSYNQRYVNTWSIFSAPIFYNYHYLVSELCISLSFGLCLLALLFGSAWLKIPFEWFPVRWVGMISYSLYMWHLPFIFVFIRYAQPLLKEWSPEQSYGVYWLWVLAAVIPFCFLFFRLVEKSGMKLGQRLVPQLGGRRRDGYGSTLSRAFAVVCANDKERKMTEYASFRQHLDAVLRTLNVEQVQSFLIAEGQWRADQPADPEFAMWMMIAGSPTLQDLHELAREWLVSHGHEEDAKTFLTGGKKQGSKPQARGQKGARAGKKVHSNRR